ncbi:hypothetical protein GCM10022378_17870 [Salinicoccus jeotgali]|uniref:DUF1850 domain-containing protein n=1 Tax=Salinicoccus jeotgali TaxID=381634 RepID=A0ABP7F2V9_9STAP
MVSSNDKKTLRRRNVFFTLIVISTVALLVILYITTPFHISISDMETGEVLYSTRIDDGERFSVEYIHSVERSPVKEIFEVRGTDIYTMESHTESFGAGMPYEGDVMELKDGKFIISEINRPVHGGALRIRPSSVFPHHIMIGEDDILISEPPFKGRNLEVNVTRAFFKRGEIDGR